MTYEDALCFYRLGAGRRVGLDRLARGRPYVARYRNRKYHEAILAVIVYALSAFVSFVSCFLKGFQHKNVIGGHVKTVYFTSWLMAAFDVAAVTLIVKGGWPIAISSGFGASLGMVVAIKFHDRIFGK